MPTPPPLEPQATTTVLAPPPEVSGLRRHVVRLTPQPRGVRWRLLGRATLTVTVASDQRTVLQMRGYGGLLRTLRQHKGKRLPRRHFISSHFSPDTRALVLADERRTLRVLSVPGARLITTIPDAIRPRWIDSNTLGFQRGCQAMSMRIGMPPRRLGTIPAPCTEVLHTSADLTRWIVADPAGKRHGSIEEFTRVRAIDLRTGTASVLVDGGVLLPKVSPDGQRVCFARANFTLHCAHNGKTELIWNEVQHPIDFDDAGGQLLFATKPKNHPRSRIVIVDFAARTAIITPRATREWWSFLPGGKRIVGHGGHSSAIVYDLRDGWQADVGSPESEWEGVWMVPGDADRFAIGRERRGTRDVYLVTLPRAR